MPGWEIITIWSLRAAILATSAIFIGRGEWIFGGFCVISVMLALVPTAAAHSAKVAWPFEVELVLLWVLLTHLTFGHLFDLYTRIGWFDKVLHVGNSFLIGFVAFQGVYVAHFLRRDREHPWIDGITILLVTLGLGALWEVGEYVLDELFGRHTQGSPTLSPLDDTMWDLLLDGLGGIIAAILGPIYMRHSRRSRARVAQFVVTRARRSNRKEELGADPFDTLEELRDVGIDRQRGRDASERP